MLAGTIPYPAEFAEAYIRHGFWKGLTVGDYLDRAIATSPDREAVVAAGARITYRELGQRVDRLALHLLELGIGQDDRVLLHLPNVAEFIYLYYALTRIGAIGIMALPAHREREIEYLLNFTSAVVHAIPTDFRGCNYVQLAEEIRPRVRSLRHILVIGEEVPEGMISVSRLLQDPIETRYPPRYLQRFHPPASDAALFQLSGGTTGFPKVVARTHNDYLYNAEALIPIMQLTPESVFLIPIPVAHNAAMLMGVLPSLLCASTLVLALTPTPEEIFRLIDQERVEVTFTVPTQVVQWLNSPLLCRYDLSSLRLLIAGGQKLQPEVGRAAEERLGCMVGNIFGMAEGFVTSTRVDDPAPVRHETVGRPISAGDEFKLLDDQHRQVNRGEIGELACRGPYTLRGYYNNPERNAIEFTEDGFFLTGDLMRLDDQGNLVVEGRKKDMIIRGGENISAEEIENLLLMHPLIENAAVVAMPDPVYGERVCAYLLTKGGHPLTLEEVIAFLLSKRIAKFKLPERVELVPSFPLTYMGKVSKQLLRQDIADKLKAEGRL